MSNPSFEGLLCELPMGRSNANFISLPIKINLTNIYGPLKTRRSLQGGNPHIIASFPSFIAKAKNSRRIKKKSGSDIKLDRAKQFRTLMDTNQWTQAKLARHLGVSRAWVTTVLNNLD